MPPKPWYRSKTVWFNVLTGVVAVAAYFGYVEDPETTARVEQVLPVIVTVVNLILRFSTKRPLAAE